MGDGAAGFFQGTVCTVLQSVIAISCSIAMIVIGSLRLNDCPVEKFIPIWLIVAGSLVLFLQVKNILKLICCPDIDEDGQLTVRKGFLDCLIPIFLLGWTIAGSVWVFRVYQPDFQENKVVTGLANTFDFNSKYCDYYTYWVAFAAILLCWILTALNMLCAVLTAICNVCCSCCR